MPLSPSTFLNQQLTNTCATEYRREYMRHVIQARTNTKMNTEILHPDSTEHASIDEVLERVYCQPTEGMSDADKLARLKELGCDDDVFLCTNINTGETSIIVKHN